MSPRDGDDSGALRILFVTSHIAWPPANGGQLRHWHVLQGLLQAGRTDAVVFPPEGGAVASEAFAGCERVVQAEASHIVLSERGRQRYQSTVGRGVLTLGNPLPFTFQIDDRARFDAQIRREVDFHSYDVVWFETTHTAAPFGRCPAPVTILDGIDFEYGLEWSLLRQSPWYGAKVWNYLDVAKLWLWERTASRRYSYVVRCSDEDVARAPAVNVVAIPNGTVVPAEVNRAPARSVLFVGELGYPPNAEGLEWFLRDVWPEVRRSVPDASLDIVGRNAGPGVRAANGTNGVTVHGFVASLAERYERAALSIAPLWAGGGTRLKILESLAHAVPVVSTTIGAFGLDAREEHGVDRIDRADAFAARCAAILLDPAAAQQRADCGREMVMAKYDWRIIERQVNDLVRRAVAASRGER